MISRKQIDSIIIKALEYNPWKLSNDILYKICEDYPSNTDKDAVLAKTLIIGRVYSAALERGVGEKKTKGGDFYIKSVFPKVSSFFSSTVVISKLNYLMSSVDFNVAIEVHGMLVKSLHGLRKSNKISFASKYLDFHYPNRFYIFDSRARKAIGILNHHFNNGERLSQQHKINSSKNVNREYLSFVSKCELLREKVRIYSQRNELSIRDFDTILINIADTIK